MRPGESSDTLLRVENLSVTIGGLRVLHDINLEVPDRTVSSVIGPNGAGKSTLFNCITQTQRADHGTIELAGRDLTHVSAHRIPHAGIARTFQHPALFAHMTVSENIAFGYDIDTPVGYIAALCRPRLVRRRRNECQQHVEQMVDELGLGPVKDTPAGSLPLGLARLVELGRALAMKPRLLLLDEPAAGLNTEESQHLAELLMQLQADAPIGIILIEHDLKFVLALAQSITVLNFGEVIAHGEPNAIANDPRVIAAYLGEVLESS